MKKLLDVEKAHAHCLERSCATEIMKKCQLWVVRWKTGQTASCQLAVCEASFRGITVKDSYCDSGINQWRKLLLETVDKLKVALADVALQSALWQSAWEDIDSQAAEMTTLQKATGV